MLFQGYKMQTLRYILTPARHRRFEIWWYHSFRAGNAFQGVMFHDYSNSRCLKLCRKKGLGTHCSKEVWYHEDLAILWQRNEPKIQGLLFQLQDYRLLDLELPLNR